MSQKLRIGENLWLSCKICWKYGFICKNHEKCENVKSRGFICKKSWKMWKCESSRIYLQNLIKNVKNWKLRTYLQKKLKKWGLFEKIGENTKNEKFEDEFALVMKICRKILKVKV